MQLSGCVHAWLYVVCGGFGRISRSVLDVLQPSSRLLYEQLNLNTGAGACAEIFQTCSDLLHTKMLSGVKVSFILISQQNAANEQNHISVWWRHPSRSTSTQSLKEVSWQTSGRTTHRCSVDVGFLTVIDISESSLFTAFSSPVCTVLSTFYQTCTNAGCFSEGAEIGMAP